MKNIKKKTILKIFLKILINIFAIIGILTISIFCYLIFDEKARCLDLKQIYDPEQKICRSDCLTWDKQIGCVPLTQENIEKKEKGLPFTK